MEYAEVQRLYVELVTEISKRVPEVGARTLPGHVPYVTFEDIMLALKDNDELLVKPDGVFSRLNYGSEEGEESYVDNFYLWTDGGVQTVKWCFSRHLEWHLHNAPEVIRFVHHLVCK